MVGIEAPSIRLKALRLPPSSRIATFSLTPSSLAFATAASTIFCASSEEMLCFFTTLAIGHFLSLDASACRYKGHANPLQYDGRDIFRDLTCGSGIHSAIHGKIRPGDVRGLWTGDEGHHRSD